MPRLRIAPIALALVLFAATACGGDGDNSDRIEDEGRRERAEEMLLAWELPEDQAECLIDELGAEMIIESPDVGVLMDSDQYQQAAESCIR